MKTRIQSDQWLQPDNKMNIFPLLQLTRKEAKFQEWETWEWWMEDGKWEVQDGKLLGKSPTKIKEEF